MKRGLLSPIPYRTGWTSRYFAYGLTSNTALQVKLKVNNLFWSKQTRTLNIPSYKMKKSRHFRGWKQRMFGSFSEQFDLLSYEQKTQTGWQHGARKARTKARTCACALQHVRVTDLRVPHNVEMSSHNNWRRSLWHFCDGQVSVP